MSQSGKVENVNPRKTQLLTQKGVVLIFVLDLIKSVVELLTKL